MLTEIKTEWSHYFVDEEEQLQGEYKTWFQNGAIDVHCFFKNGLRHGEYLSLYSGRIVFAHCFFINGKQVSFNEIPLPTTSEDRVYFTLKYNIPLLPVETVC